MMKNKLPNGWVECTLSNIGEIVSGGTPSTTEADNFGGNIAWITPADLSKYNDKYISAGSRNITEKGLISSSAKLMPKGSILFSSRAPIGYVVIASNDISTNQGFKNIAPSKYINNEYVYYYLKASKNLAEKFASGTTFKEISGTSFSKLPIPIAPLNEQKRIVEKIEELFADVDSGIEKLKKSKDELKQYRQSVLKSAFEGKLYKTTEWKETNIKNISEYIQYGYTESSSKDKVGPKFLRITDIQNDFVNWKNVPYCKISNEEMNRYLLNNNDFVFARTGATVGKSYLISNLNEPAIFASYLIRIRFNKDINIKYIKYYFKSTSYWIQIIDKQLGTGQPNVNGSRLGQLYISIPTLQEQEKIVEEIEKRFTKADILEKAIDESLEQAKQLKQSILKKAFEGSLVPQDPKDEPASVLLEKIKAEKATSIKKGKK